MSPRGIPNAKPDEITTTLKAEPKEEVAVVDDTPNETTDTKAEEPQKDEEKKPRNLVFRQVSQKNLDGLIAEHDDDYSLVSIDLSSRDNTFTVVFTRA